MAFYAANNDADRSAAMTPLQVIGVLLKPGILDQAFFVNKF
jgi:hypothetical protein